MMFKSADSEDHRLIIREMIFEVALCVPNNLSVGYVITVPQRHRWTEGRLSMAIPAQ